MIAPSIDKRLINDKEGSVITDDFKTTFVEDLPTQATKNSIAQMRRSFKVTVGCDRNAPMT